MLDLVLAGDLPKLAGIGTLIGVSSLQNFRQPADAAASRAESRREGALIYIASYEPDEGALVELARRNGALAFAFSDVLRERGFRRAIVLSKMRLALAACRRAGCGFVACTLARSEGGLRNAREISAFMSVLGMDGRERKFSGELLERLAAGGRKNEGGSAGGKKLPAGKPEEKEIA